jgi:uncharacterized protein DUF2795
MHHPLHVQPSHRLWRVSFLAGVLAGGILGWLARPLVSRYTRRGAKRPRAVTPIQVQLSLKGVDYPAGKPAWLARAEAAGAEAPVLETLTQVPAHCYRRPIEVSRALGHQAREADGGA